VRFIIQFPQTDRDRVKPAALLLCLLLIVTLLLTAVSPAVLAETTDQSLQEAEKRQSELNSRIAALEKETDQLANTRSQITGKLSWLNSRSSEQRALYQQKTLQLTEALKEMSAANQAWLDAGATLADRQEQYQKRMQSMFEHRTRSWFEIFIE